MQSDHHETFRRLGLVASLFVFTLLRTRKPTATTPVHGPTVSKLPLYMMACGGAKRFASRRRASDAEPGRSPNGYYVPR